MRRRVAHLTAEQERDLFARWHAGDEKALHAVIEAHGALAMKLAKRTRVRGALLDECMQEANVGLLEAAKRFDPAKGFRFSTYAAWWVKAQLQAFLITNASIVKAPRDGSSRRCYAALRGMRGRGETDATGRIARAAIEGLAATLNMKLDRVEALEAHVMAPNISLNVSSLDDGEDKIGLLVDEADPFAVECRIDLDRRVAALGRAMLTLNRRERQIIRQRRLTEEGATLEKVGGIIGVSKERVRQIETVALKKLRRALVAEGVA